jgi:hypothetical protein
MILSASSSNSTLVSVDAKTPQDKDYLAAFGSLQSAYGLSAPPIVAPLASRKTQPTPVAVQVPAPSADTKDYAAAFGALQSSYGFTGPTVVPAASARKAKTSKCSPKKAPRDDQVDAKDTALAALVKKFSFAGGLPGQFSMHRARR